MSRLSVRELPSAGHVYGEQALVNSVSHLGHEIVRVKPLACLHPSGLLIEDGLGRLGFVLVDP